MFELVIVNPFGTRGEYATIGNSVLKIWLQLKQLVSGLEHSLVLAASVSNHYLGGVLVGHHDGGLWKAGTEGSWVVGLKRFLDHAGM